ncbi:MAG: NERD domain-containing protein, partial [Burkholderiales bacterium]|nr:NERD domain-containing protein [Burkholderiales bacterium]
MATMIPADIAEFKTEGEGRFYHFLEQVAKPDEQYLAWYTPDINGMEPDFLIYAKDIGIVIFEVKDWVLEQIVKADSHTFILQSGTKTEAKKNPYHQARQYYEQTIDKIKKDKRLVSKEPIHHGNPKIPIHYGVVFSNINRYEYMQKHLDSVIDKDKVFFWDDIHPESDICTDTKGKTFHRVLKDKFPPKFPFTISDSEISHLRQLIFPSVCIELPERKKEAGYAVHQKHVQMLDHHQEAIARKFDSGHRIITGPSGSGKTLVLVHKAGFLKQYNPSIKNILFVCYNITLVNYIKRLLAGKKIPLGENGVEVMHFFELCSRITGENVHYEKEDKAYYETVIELALAKADECPLKYDAILVDEGQDFSDDMYRVLVALLNR